MQFARFDFKWAKVFKNGPSKICGRQPLKIWSEMVCLSRPYQFKFFKGCLLLGAFLNTLTQMMINNFDCLSVHLQKSKKPQIHHNWFLINFDWLANEKGPTFETYSSKSCKIFLKNNAHNYFNELARFHD